MLPCVLVLARAAKVPANGRERQKRETFEAWSIRFRKCSQAFAKGELVVVTDDEDREVEGDLIVAASALHCREDGVHHPPYLGHRLRADHDGGRAAGCGSIRWSRTRRIPITTTAFTVSIDYKPDGGTRHLGG